MFFCACDVVIIAFSLFVSFLFRFDFEVTPQYRWMILRALPLFLLVKIGMLALFKIYLNPANKAKPCCRNRIEMVGFPRYSAVY